MASSPPFETEFFCSLVSQQVGEQLFATAGQTLVWLLLEYPYPWGRKAFADSHLPPAVKERLSSWLAAIPASRLQLIKGAPSRFPEQIAFFIARGDESGAFLSAFPLRSYDDLLALDLPALLSGDPAFQGNIIQQPLYLVCTNGKRDPCCAKFGLPLYSGLAALAPGLTWQVSHVGGHRFAPNLVCLPHGIYYGRVDLSQADTIVAAAQNGQVYLEKYRGRACYPPEVQAADYFLRAQTGSRRLDAFRLLSIQKTAPTSWLVRFSAAVGEKAHNLHVIGAESEFANYQSCRDTETSRVVQYRLSRYEVSDTEND